MSAGTRGDRLSLVVFLLGCGGVSAIGGWATSTSVATWYTGLARPAFTPPDWVFAPVWTVLFLLIAIAGWRVWLRRRSCNVGAALTVYTIQLALNLGWSLLFFGMQRVDLATIKILLLWTAIALNLLLFVRIDRIAGLLLAPYLLWVSFAALLTVRIWQLNG